MMEQILHRFPIMADAEIRQMVNGPESFTPDTHYLVGEAPEVCVCMCVCACRLGTILTHIP